MNLIKALVDDVFGHRDATVSDVLDKHVSDTFRQRTDGLWEDRLAVVSRLERVRDAVQSVRIRVVNELSDGRAYAERHIVTVITRDGTEASRDVFVFAELDQGGRFLCIEELSLPTKTRQ